MKRALLLLGGTMKGAYLVGVMRVLYDELGPTYFHSIYSRSVGIFEQAFFASRQPETMERTWREYVSGNQLIRLSNIFKGKPILDLDYLIRIFKTEKSLLYLDKVDESPLKLFAYATDVETRLPVLFDLKSENIFDVMRASCALPYVYPAVEIHGRRYMDGALSNREAWNSAMTNLYEQFDEIIVIVNKNTDEQFVPSHPKVKVIQPSHMPLWHSFDTNQKRIIATIEQGKKDALDFIARG